jgi:hypothetical protein
MALFPNLRSEGTIQVDDRSRLDASGSFKDKGEGTISLVRIKPSASDSFIIVTGASSKDWYLDWEYSSAGTKTVTVELTSTGSPTTKDFTLTVVTAATDKLFSSDQDLIEHEPDIMKWVQAGRNSFLNIHRRAQERILAFLDEKGYTDTNGDRLDKDAVIDTQELKEWSAFMTLKLIFLGLSNSVEDVFMQKAKNYESREVEARNRSILRLDFDGDAALDDGESVRITSTRLYRV